MAPARCLHWAEEEDGPETPAPTPSQAQLGR